MQSKEGRPAKPAFGREFWKEMCRHRTLYLMCVPALALLAVLCYIPFGGAWMAFTKFNVVDGIFGSPFAGLDNFVMFFEIGAAARVVYNTLFINVFGIILGLVFPISLAISLNELQKGVFKRVAQGVMFFPYFLSWVVVGAIAYGLFSTDVGVVNAFLRDLGAQPIRWYAEPKYWKGFLIAFEVWKWSGYSSIIYLAAMANFDPNLFEAAEVDGASKWQRIVHLTIPMLKPTAVVLTLMSIGRIFYGDFGMVYGIVGTNPVLSSEVEVIDIHVYGSMRALGFSYATAVGLMQSVMGLIMVTLSNRLAKRLNEGEGLF